LPKRQRAGRRQPLP